VAEITDDPAVAIAFRVHIEGHDIGTFTGCEGLGVEVQIEQREEGGNNAFVHQLPGRLKYTNVKLTRTVGRDTAKIRSWFASMATDGLQRTTAHIAALGIDGQPVVEWDLTGVVPVRWSGPSMTADGGKVATETLELAHHGFL